MRRITSILLTLCIIFVLLPFPASAANVVDSGEWGESGSDVHWSLDSDGNMTFSGTGVMSDSRFLGVDRLGKEEWIRPWDRHMHSIKTVTIEEGITYVGGESFHGAGNLTKITIADTVAEIGFNAFANCDSLVDIHLGAGLKKIDVAVFSDCDALKTFIFPDYSVEYGNHLLASCDNLENVVFSDKMTVITDGMFDSCVSLKNLSLPTSITHLGSDAFAMCTGLTEITIPESVIDISDRAFAYCSNLKKISLPNTLINMRSSIFASCMSLSTITVPVSVTSMAHTFAEAYGLKSVKFMGNAPFAGSNLFGNITITAYYPSNNPSWTETVRQDYGGHVTWIGYESDIKPSDTFASGTCGDNANWVLKNDFTLVISGTGKMEDYWSYEAPWHDYVQRIEHVIIEPGITNVGNHAFIDCRTLMSVSLPSTITQIGKSSFHNCRNVSTLEIPESVSSIGDGAFSGCVGLEHITFRGDAPEFGAVVFREITTKVFYPAENETWTAEIMQNYGGEITWEKKHMSHIYTSVVTEPTCTESGYTTHTCSYCGDSYVDSYVDATGHIFGEWVETKEPPSCTERGEESRSCVCGETETRKTHTLEHEYDDNDICADCGHNKNHVPMYRLYNPYTHEHLLTSNTDEMDQLVNVGWSLDGIAWNAPSSGLFVYRLYNPFDDWHTYTLSQEEIDILVPLGWKVDGVVCYSATEADVVPIYRLFNPYEKTNYHLLTANPEERDLLEKAGWIVEGIAWNAVK